MVNISKLKNKQGQAPIMHETQREIWVNSIRYLSLLTKSKTLYLNRPHLQEPTY